MCRNETLTSAVITSYSHTVWNVSTDSQLIFHRNILPPSSWSKNEPNSFCDLLVAGPFISLFFDPEDGSEMFLQNIS
jgi:hypothetical protein